MLLKPLLMLQVYLYNTLMLLKKNVLKREDNPDRDIVMIPPGLMDLSLHLTV